VSEEGGKEVSQQEAAMDSVVQLVNRLQSAATLLGDNAASDKSLPSLWELLPSIVVIGGQVLLLSNSAQPPAIQMDS
jgi:hypothetical protein